jgi:hypothetical protein
MYSKTEISQIKHAFWIAFGRYMAPHLSSEGLKINWINYKTGFQNLYFKMVAGSKSASISIEITHPDNSEKEIYFQYFEEFQIIMHDYLSEQWKWEPNYIDQNGKEIGKISITIFDVNVMNQNDWPKIISFLKPRIIALDEFWNDVKDRFEA